MSTGPTAETRHGVVQGAEEGGVAVFKGIPYAAPPVGDLRFRAPVPPERWTGVRDATAFSPIAPQPPSVRGVAMGDEQPQSEDCLYLNVWTPAADGDKRPVMVWIHGGAFQSGSGSMGLYRGANLAANGDVVVVTINYRLGLLGWLACDELGGGNWGLLDQIAALQWVQDNVASFGGDPGNVTIFGESAGSVSVSTLFGTPAAKGLFHKAIAQSGGPGGFSMRFAEKFAAEVVEAAGVDSVSALRDVPLDELVALQDRVIPVGRRLATPLAPVVDGKVLTRPPIEEIRTGLNKDVPFIVGTNRDEMTYFAMGDRRLTSADDALLRRRLVRTIGDETAVEEVIEGYAKARADRGDGTSPFELWVAIESDRFFRIPALRMAEAHAATGSPVYDYLFDWESPAVGGLLKSCHALEIAFAFGNLKAPMMNVFAGEGPDAETLSDAMAGAWLAFARTGDPASPGIGGEWPRYDATERPTLRLGRRIEVINAPYDEERRVWDGRTVGRMSAA